MAKTIESHLPCPSCESSDARTVYEDDEGQQFWKCYSCGEVKQMTDNVVATKPFRASTGASQGSVAGILERSITKAVCTHYGVLTSPLGYVFPYTGGHKTRIKDKKEFFQSGKLSGLFGQDRFPSGGKYVTITEGEFDALSVFQMFSNKYPAVSIRNGAEAALKDCRESYDWLDSFENIVICFDNDKPGQEAAKKVADLFGAKASIVKLQQYKDANEYLMHNDSKTFVDLWWRAEKYIPDGIVAGTDMWNRMQDRKAKESFCAYPFTGVQKLSYGLRHGEILTVVAGSGVGKTQCVREIIYNVLSSTKECVGIMAMEETLEETSLGLMSLAAGKPLHLPTTQYTQEEYRAAYEATIGSGRVFLFDHADSFNIDSLASRVRYFAKGLGCGVVVFDHISIAVSGQQEKDERKAIDALMTRLRGIVEETGICLIIVAHLNRPEGKGHEEGAQVSAKQLRGSGGIYMLSNMVLALEGNRQADDLIERNTTNFRWVKNRFSGDTGPCGSALYSKETGRMVEIAEEVL